MRVGFFTAGTDGAGHIVRAVAIARAFERAGAAVDYRVFVPPGPFRRVAGDLVEEVAVDAGALADPSRAPESSLARALLEYGPDVLIVDLFWAPLRFVSLPGVATWLLLRQAPPAWLQGPPGVPFESSRFDRILAIEPGTPFDVERLQPIVVCNPTEVVDPMEARRRLRAPSEGSLTLVVHAGLVGEVERLTASVGEATTIVVADLRSPQAPFPIAPLLPAADHVVGAAGYNLFWETRWLGVETRSRLTPIPRKIDLPARRVAAANAFRMTENGADSLVARILRG